MAEAVDDQRVGPVLDGTGARFAVVSGGDAVEVCLLDEAGGERRVPLDRGEAGRWHGHVPGAGPRTTYGFRVAGAWAPEEGHRYDHDRLLLDPYARAITRVDGELRSVLVDESFDWTGDRAPRVAWPDTVLYELHVKGFTELHPDVPERLRGTYAGLAHPAVVEHLTGLGVTTVELLPVHQFVSEPALAARGLVNYWGYNSVGFFAPHAGYSAAGSTGQQVAEFKSMVAALHRAGIEVVLDVVYNHTGEGDATGPTLCWRGLDNHGYYRLTPEHDYVDTTGCGNVLDLTYPPALAMVLDSLRYWVEQMHVDGFRFDLATSLSRTGEWFDPASPFLTALAADPVLASVKLIAEPWDVGPGGYQLGRFPPPWGEWNDRYRDTVRSTWLGSRGGPPSGLRDLAYALSGSSNVFDGRSPLASVNFVTAHDGFTLADLVSYDRKHNEANGEHGRDGAGDNRSWNCGHEGPTDDSEVLRLRRRMSRNLLTTLLVSTGVPMITAGDETGRSQLGNNNAYCLDDVTSWVSWDHAEWQRELLEWARALVRLRRERRVLRHDEFFDGRPAHEDGVKDLAWFAGDGNEVTPSQWFDHDHRVLGMYLSGSGSGSRADVAGRGAGRLLVWVNAGPVEEAVVLPGAPWGTEYDVLLDTADERPTPGLRHDTGGRVRLSPFSVAVLGVAG
ncbi:MAG: isoamylase [Actinomycetota bacterium]|nr:isoamylase [Actinomycetota bacterium]